MPVARKTYAPEVADAILARIRTQFATPWGLKLLRIGGLEWLLLPQSLDNLVPGCLVEVAVNRSEPGKLQSWVYTYSATVRLAMPLVDDAQNQRTLLGRLRDLHDEFNAEGLTLAVSVDPPESWGFRTCRAISYALDADATIASGLLVGTVDIEVAASADPYIPD